MKIFRIKMLLFVLSSLYCVSSIKLIARNKDKGHGKSNYSLTTPMNSTKKDFLYDWSTNHIASSLTDFKKSVDKPHFSINPLVPTCDNGTTTFRLASANYSNGVVSFVFNASNLSEGNWMIKKGTTVVIQGTFRPSSSTVVVNVGTLAADTYKLIVDGVSCIGSATIDFTVTAPTPTPVGPSCDNGSTPFYIISTALNKKLLTFEVNANNFSSGRWTVLQDTTVISSANLTVTSNIMTVNVGQMAEGNYRFKLDGVSCNGTTTKTFRALPDMPLSSTVSVTPCNTDKILFVLSGESNSGGRALNTELSTLELSMRDSLKILNNDTYQFESLKVGTNNLLNHFTLINGTTHGLEVAIANRVRQQTFYNKIAYVVKTGQGKSLMSDWDTSGVYYKTLVTRVKAAKQVLANNNTSYKTVILYSQGINDLLAGVSSYTWKISTKQHFQALRNEFGSNTLIIMTKFMPQYSGYNGVIDEICAETPNTYSVDTWDAQLADDKHWNANGFKLIGERMMQIVERFTFVNAHRGGTASPSSSVTLSPAAICAGSNPLLMAIPSLDAGNTPLFQWYKNGTALPFFANKTTFNGLGNNLVNSIAIGNDDKIYAGTARGLSISTDGGNTFVNKITTANANSNSIRGVAVSSTGKIYVATAFDGIGVSTDGGNTFVSKTTAQGLASNSTRGVFVDSEGKVYVATVSGLSISTDGGNSFSNRNTNSGLPSNSTQCVFVGSDGKVYVGTNSAGIGVSTNGGNSFTTYNTNNGLGDGNVFSIYVNSAGKIYAATAYGLSISTNGGLNFTNYTTTNGLGDDYVYSIMVSSDSRIYAGTYGGGLSVSNDGGTTFNNFTVTSGLGDDRVRAIGMNSTGKLFIGSNNGVSIGNKDSYAVANATASDNYTVSMATICPVTGVSTASVTVAPMPTAPTLVNKTICRATSTTLTGTCITGTLTWYSDSTSTTPLGTNAFITPIINNTTDYYAACQVGTTNSCVSRRAKLTLGMAVSPTVPTTANKSVCSGNSTTLAATCVTGTPTWYQTVSDTAKIGTNTFTTPILTANRSYFVSCNSSTNCASSRTEVIVSAVATPTAPTVVNQIICNGSSATLTATCATGTVKWYNTATSTTVLGTGSYVTSALTSDTNFYAGCQTTGAAICDGLRARVTITVNALPRVPTANNISICYNTTATLTAVCLTGTVRWYANTTATAPLASGNYTTSLLTESTNYYVACESGGTPNCSSSRVRVSVTVNALVPMPTGASNQSVYAGNTASLSATGCTGAGFALRWYESVTNTSSQMPVSPPTTKNYYAKCEQSVNSITCVSPRSTDITLTVIRRVFVDSSKVGNATQNGNSWATAYASLMTGIEVAASGNEIWVAKGTYKPTTDNIKTSSFMIPSGVKIYGGFAGTETFLTERILGTMPSILSGEIGDASLVSDNTYHVVQFDATNNQTLLNGFTITGGNANYISVAELAVPYTPTAVVTDNTGGGIVIKNGASPTIANCTVKLNRAKVGGGIFCANNSLAQIISCKIMANIASIGGAIYQQQSSNSIIKSTQITGNKGKGEAIYSHTSIPVVSNCTIVGSGGDLPAVYNGTDSPTIFQNCVMSGYTTLFNDTQARVNYCNLSGTYAGLGNTTYDPLFETPLLANANVSTEGNFQLRANSPAIDAGNNAFVVIDDKDILSRLRIFNQGRVDLGAYEYQGVRTGGTVTSIKTGNWEDPTTWDIGRIPYAGDSVIIAPNHTVSINSIGIAKTIDYKLRSVLTFTSSTTGLQLGL